MSITLPYPDTIASRARPIRRAVRSSAALIGRVSAFALVVAGLAAPVCLPVAATAETTAWAQNEGGRMRIVTLPPDAAGRVRGGLEIEPKPGWITYWREPGEAGIPPRLSLADGAAATIGDIEFPVPRRVGDGKLLDIGYDKPVTLPFELTVADPQTPQPVTVSGFIGLCREICIPFQADFALQLKPQPITPPEEFMILQRAGAFLPDPPSMDFAVTHYALTDAQKTLQLALRLPQGTRAPPQVLVTGPEGYVLFDEAGGRREGDSYMVDMPIARLPVRYEMRGKRWTILVIAGTRSMQTSLAFD
ncbi:protein-disulfide reductase DsbD domain-containing protein [Neorhizobium sp. NPDC001467]|uniref:protein-disulfide reductase DsbD domain-containing protein n=1 Tax=Neorhizobium sp. NPDC001467 TaxID=3390595 RepID=UPI003D01426E